jgi:hypothetical protein
MAVVLESLEAAVDRIERTGLAIAAVKRMAHRQSHKAKES